MASPSPARRAFLRGSTRAAQPLRPPWSLAEDVFSDRCTRCGDCGEACPETLIVRGDGGFPVVDFSRGECTFCGACADACEAAAFGPRDVAPWRLAPSIADACLARHGVHCEVCRDACATGALRFKPRVPVSLPEPDAALCTGCGACVSACPVAAIALAPGAAA
ncbi:MAG TPA: ferredoxin-type protein NapF [Tahibacter sp.]|nr:ferredoxin-type protein NapF [Tahibacter sp.]